MIKSQVLADTIITFILFKIKKLYVGYFQRGKG